MQGYEAVSGLFFLAGMAGSASRFSVGYGRPAGPVGIPYGRSNLDGIRRPQFWYVPMSRNAGRGKLYPEPLAISLWAV